MSSGNTFGRMDPDMSVESEGQGEQQLTLGGVGQTLREARESQGLELKQIAAETRIPERHLIAIENGDFGALPARTYAVGFSRSYARMLGLDEKLVAADVRAELSSGGEHGGGLADQFDPGDPARIPSRRLAWFSGLAALLLIVGGFSFYRSHIAPASGPAPLVEDQTDADDIEPETDDLEAIDPQGAVVFTALEDGVWARFYNGNGSRLFEKQMAQGESFVVPEDAVAPQIWTGRPDALAITIGGREVPKLAEDDLVLRDVAIDAASLLARGDAELTAAVVLGGPSTAPARTQNAPTPSSPPLAVAPAPAASEQVSVDPQQSSPNVETDNETEPVQGAAGLANTANGEDATAPVDNSAT